MVANTDPDPIAEENQKRLRAATDRLERGRGTWNDLYTWSTNHGVSPRVSGNRDFMPRIKTFHIDGTWSGGRWFVYLPDQKVLQMGRRPWQEANSDGSLLRPGRLADPVSLWRIARRVSAHTDVARKAWWAAKEELEVHLEEGPVYAWREDGQRKRELVVFRQGRSGSWEWLSSFMRSEKLSRGARLAKLGAAVGVADSPAGAAAERYIYAEYRYHEWGQRALVTRRYFEHAIRLRLPPPRVGELQLHQVDLPESHTEIWCSSADTPRSAPPPQWLRLYSVHRDKPLPILDLRET